MKTLPLKDFFSDVETGTYAPSMLFKGEDPYVEKEILAAFKKNNFEIDKRVLGPQGPTSEHLDTFSACSLFSSKKVLWLESHQTAKGWSEASLKIWKQILLQTNVQDLLVVLKVPLDKRLKWDFLELAIEVDLTSANLDKKFWLGRINNLKGKALQASQLHYLATFDEDLLTLENWIELWSLGGDIWAQRQIHWGEPSTASSSQNSGTQQPSFAWVDAILQSKPKLAVELTNRLLNKDLSEPLQLLGLLAKSAKILRAIEIEGDLSEYPPFLVKKLSAYRGKGIKLLRYCAILDKQLKTTSMDPQASLAWIGTQSIKGS